MDRRQARTRRALHRALLELLAEKPWSEITVEEIAECADIARPTFYAHFPDKSALLQDATEQLMTELAERIADVVPKNVAVYTGAGVIALLRHAQEHATLYRLLTGAEGAGQPRMTLVAALRRTSADIFFELGRRIGTKRRVPMHEITAAFTGALMAVLHDWLRDEIKGTPEEVGTRFIRGQVGGLEWMLGLESGAFAFDPA
jgi:AcrR family transcriptional regulator